MERGSGDSVIVIIAFRTGFCLKVLAIVVLVCDPLISIRSCACTPLVNLIQDSNCLQIAVEIVASEMHGTEIFTPSLTAMYRERSTLLGPTLWGHHPHNIMKHASMPLVRYVHYQISDNLQRICKLVYQPQYFMYDIIIPPGLVISQQHQLPQYVRNQFDCSLIICSSAHELYSSCSS